MIISNPIELQAKKIHGKKSKSKGIWRTLILRPSEYEQIYSDSTRKYQIIFSCLLYTGMRYEELKRLRRNPQWIDANGFIHLPADAQKKEKRVDPERWIRLSYRGREAVRRLYDLRPEELPASPTIDQYIKRNWPKLKTFSMKTFRKTWESWCVFYFKNPLLVAQSQGHTLLTQFNHYISMPWTEKDRLEMKPHVEGYIES